MPEVPGERLCVSVGRREFEELAGAWAAYVEVANTSAGSVDPVLAMQRTGSIVRSLERLIPTMIFNPVNPVGEAGSSQRESAIYECKPPGRCDENAG